MAEKKKGTVGKEKVKVEEEVKVVAVDEKEKNEVLVIEEVREMSEIVEEIQNNVPQLFEKAQRNLLLNETPRYKIKQRKGKGGMMFDYVDVGYVLEQLNILTGHRWDFEIIEICNFIEAKETGEVWCDGKMTLYGKDGQKKIIMDSGNAEVKMKQSGGFLSWGNDRKASISDCIKRCARQFGIALDVYSGAIKRRQDTTHPEATITESQRRRLEVLAGEAKMGHAGLKKLINEQYDYSSTTEIQRRHFQEISVLLEEKSAGVKVLDIPEEIQQGFEILGTPKAKRIAVYNSYKAQGKLEELKKRISQKVDEKNSAKDESTTQDESTK